MGTKYIEIKISKVNAFCLIFNNRFSYEQMTRFFYSILLSGKVKNIGHITDEKKSSSST